MPDNRPTAVARNSNTFLPVNLLGFSLFGFLEAALCGFDSPARTSMKCEEFTDGNQLVVCGELPSVDPESGIKVSVSDRVLTIQPPVTAPSPSKNHDKDPS
jgi:hypothetical protein